MKVRMLEHSDLLPAMHLVWDVFAEHTAPLYQREGVEEFQKFIKIEHIVELYNRGELYLWGMFEGNDLLGVSAMYKSGHISLLEVRTAFQNQGIGKVLLEHMCQFCMHKLGMMRLTVHAAPNAVTVYQGYGFQISSAEQEEKGVRYVAMEFIMSPEHMVKPVKKSHTSLIIGIVAVLVLLGVVLVFFVSRAMGRMMRGSIEGPSLNQWEEDYDNGYDDYDDYGDYNDNYGEEEYSNGFESVPVYKADDLSYEVKDETYSETNDNSTSLNIDIVYPVLSGIANGQETSVNEILKTSAMQSAEEYYLNPDEETKEFILGQATPYVSSMVEYKTMYMSNDMISVMFMDYYYKGDPNKFYMGVRTETINLKDGKSYEVKDLVNLDDTFMTKWLEVMEQEAGEGNEMLDMLTLDEMKGILSGDEKRDGYTPEFFFSADGLEIGISYVSDELESTGCVTAPFTLEEIAPYQTDNSLWEIVKSHN